MDWGQTGVANTLSEKLMRERRARLAAERYLEQTRRELTRVRDRLAYHEQHLTNQIVAQRKGLEQALTEAQSLKGENSKVRDDLERAMAEAQNARHRLLDALETFRDGFAIYDRALHLVMANHAYLDMFPMDVMIEPGIGYGTVMKSLAASGLIEMDGRTPVEWQREMLARLKAGAGLVPAVLRTRSGRHVKLIERWGDDGDLVCLVQDITDVVTREEELEDARRKAEAANRAKGAFLANMSHEIRTPMNGIVGMAELMSETELTEEQTLFVDTIRSSGDALLTIINEILDYSKIEADRMRLYPEPFDLERCLYEVMALLMPATRDKDLRLLVDYDMLLPTRFVGDQGRIRQILTNLIGNAVKFTPAGHVITRVAGFARGTNDFDLHFTVEDTGIGIAANDLDRIFGEFNQVETSATRRFEGTGLGLAITRQLIELMGGKVWVKSELGRGSSFGFSIQLPAAEKIDPVPATPEPVTLRVALVIDDILVNRMILERQLEAHGIKVTACRNAAEAYRMIDGGADFDVVLADQAVADVNGLELVRKIREAGNETPIVMMAAEVDNCAEMSARDPLLNCLQKPVLRADLFRLLGQLSREHRPEQVKLAPPPPAPGPGTRRQMRILTAEDNRTNQLVFRKMVKDLDIDLQFANDGHEAVEMWEKFRPDLIFMDISMPQMDGRDAMRAIRAREASQGIRVPICALTAFAMADHNSEIIAAGADHYMTKPLRRAAIVQQIVDATPAICRPVLNGPA